MRHNIYMHHFDSFQIVAQIFTIMLVSFRKVFLLLFFVSFLPKLTFAQAETFVENLPNVCEMHVHQDHLYFTIFEIDQDDNPIGRLGKIDLREENVEVEYLLDIDLGFTGLYFKEDLVYYTVHTDPKIYIRNINDLEEAPVVFVDNLYHTGDINIVGSKLFVTASFDLSYGPFMYMYDLDFPENRPTILFDTILPISRIVTDNEYLYFGTWNREIYRWDLLNSESEPEILLDSLRFPVGLAVVDNFLYFTNLPEGYSFINSKISRIDLADEQRNISVLYEYLQGPHELVEYDGYVYISEFFENKISRLPIPISTNVSDNINVDQIKVFPNPASQYLQLTGKENLGYEIFTLDGREVKSGQINLDSKINVNQLPTGFYFIHLSDGSVARFQVEGN